MKLSIKLISLALIAATVSTTALLVSANNHHFEEIRDLLTDSRPGELSNHTFSMTNTFAIPPSGKLIIDFQGSGFDIPGTFSHEDIDLLVEEPGESLEQRDLSTGPTIVQDGVGVTSGEGGKIEITLNSTEGIPADSQIQVLLGTNALYPDSGENRIQNPESDGSKPIQVESRDDADELLNERKIWVVIVEPVSVGPFQLTIGPPNRFNRFPDGDELGSGTQEVEISLNTEFIAQCRYAEEPGVEYEDMENIITSSFTTVHSKVIDELQDGQEYNFYVRCINFQGETNEDDFLISFTIKETPEEDSEPGEVGEEDVPGSGGGSGGGGLPYPPDTSTLHLNGLAHPDSTVFLLQDGSIVTQRSAGSGAQFSFTVSELTKGTYTFTVYAEDSAGRKSANHNSTLTIRPDTNNTISNIFLSPTISLANTSLDPSEPLEVSGTALPNEEVELWINKQNQMSEEEAEKESATSSSSGEWSISFDTEGMSIGTYGARAKTIVSESEESDLTAPASFGIGVDVDADGIPGDLNFDGSVNLVDFSILLFNWETSNAVADINGDNAVNISDFSIMLFNWTG